MVTPGITIRDRLRVLQPNDPDSYYRKHELAPQDMLPDLGQAKIVITNYHTFLLRERTRLARGTRALLKGHGKDIATVETEGQMLQRACGELMGMTNILVLNDEAHHCYREKPGDTEEGPYTGDERQEAKENTEAARLWISGLETVQRKIGIRAVFDLSATPFFLSGSGYAEGTLFPWTTCDFSLLDAIECGIVKLPRVPVADNVPHAEMPRYRELWKHIGPAERNRRALRPLREGLRRLARSGHRGAANYDMASFFVRHAYFLGANDPYKALKTTLKAEIDAQAWRSLHSDTSRPFEKPSSGRIAVKAINHLGDEVMKVVQVR